MIISSLGMPSLILVILYSTLLYIIKSRFPSRIRVFFKSFFVAVAILSSFCWLGSESILAYFGLGIMACMIGLSEFRALPYIPGRTRTEAKFKFRGRPMHHSTMGIMLIVVMVLLEILFDIQMPFTLIFSFLYGGVVFAITSQIPEMFEHRAVFF